MNVMVSCDDNYCKYTTVMLISLCKTNKMKIKVWLVHTSGLSSVNVSHMKTWLQKYNHIEIIDICREDMLDEKKFAKSPIYHWSKESYYRLLAQEVIPDNVTRILWLDSDIIIKSDIWDFYSQDFGDKYLVACEDLGMGVARKSELEKKYILGSEFLYCNSGVVLFDLDKMRKNIDTVEMLSFLMENERTFHWPDQDLINVYFKDAIKYDNPYIYNCIVAAGSVNSNKYIYNAKILHFAGRKPWNNDVAWRCNDFVAYIYWWKTAKNVYGKKNYYKWLVVSCFVNFWWKIVWGIGGMLKQLVKYKFK